MAGALRAWRALPPAAATVLLNRQRVSDTLEDEDRDMLNVRRHGAGCVAEAGGKGGSGDARGVDDDLNLHRALCKQKKK